MTTAHEFGLSLRRAREQRGLSVDEVSRQTKVLASLYVGLERGDISRWPAGIFGRAFVRAYAECIGLDPAIVVADFERVFANPQAASAPVALPSAPVADHDALGQESLRLTLATGRERWPSSDRVLGVLVDVVVALGLGILAAQLARGWSGVPVEAAVFGVVLAYYVVGHLGWGTSAGVVVAGRLVGKKARVALALHRAAGDVPSEAQRPAISELRGGRARTERRRAQRAERASSRQAHR